MFLSTLVNTTVLVVPAVTLLLTFISYGKQFFFFFFFFLDMDLFIYIYILYLVIAAIKKQPYASTKILGGTGVDNVV
jgi:hypothetical protein